MPVDIARIIQEYVVLPDDVDHAVRCRVVEFLDADPLLRYGWEISHYCKGTKSALGAYRPSRTRGDSVDEVEKMMLAYANNFTGIGVEPNPYY